jgi:hypothetical protein
MEFFRIKSTAGGSDDISFIFIRIILEYMRVSQTKQGKCIGNAMLHTLFWLRHSHMLPALTHIFNFCITNFVFPNVWKKAFVCPLPKIKNPSSVSDIRPICILPVFSKALEYAIFDQLDL